MQELGTSRSLTRSHNRVLKTLPTVAWEDESPGQTAHPDRRDALRRAGTSYVARAFECVLARRHPVSRSSAPLPQVDDLPGGWHEEIHMDGHPYYRNDHKNATTNINLRTYHTDPLEYVPADPEMQWPSDWEINIGDHGITWIDHQRMAVSSPNQKPPDFMDSMKAGGNDASCVRRIPAALVADVVQRFSAICSTGHTSNGSPIMSV